MTPSQHPSGKDEVIKHTVCLAPRERSVNGSCHVIVFVGEGFMGVSGAQGREISFRGAYVGLM